MFLIRYLFCHSNLLFTRFLFASRVEFNQFLATFVLILN